MLESKRVIDSVLKKIESNCKFKIRDESSCYLTLIVEEILREIKENGEVVLKEKLLTDAPIQIIDGVVSVSDGKLTEIISTEGSELQIK